MSAPMKDQHDVVVTPDCTIRGWIGGAIEIGRDMHMNGLDSPAVLHSPSELRALASKLLEVADNWEAN